MAEKKRLPNSVVRKPGSTPPWRQKTVLLLFAMKPASAWMMP
jgi:hypothetical protein